MALCNQCKAITATSLLSVEGYLLHDDFGRLTNSAAHCDSCKLLLTCLRAAIEACYESADPDLDQTILLIIKPLLHVADGAAQASSDSSRSGPVILRHSQSYPFGSNKPVPRSLLRLRRQPTETSSILLSLGHLANGSTLQYAHGNKKAVSWSITWSKQPNLGICIVTNVPVYTYLGDPGQWLGFQVRNPLAPSSIDTKVVSLAKEWVKHCMMTHSECQSIKTGPDPYPRRLIKLQALDEANKYEIVDIPANFNNEYVALSYCWGSIPKFWMEYIVNVQREPVMIVEYEMMPQTIKDGVRSCLALGYMYLWIDCLCIMQGDTSDWLEESTRMSVIFTNAALVISASNAANCTDGFLQPRSQLQQGGVVLPLALNDKDKGDTTSNLHLCLPGADFGNVVGRGAVAGRAWCLQERQLATRVLHICQSEVFFECMLSRHAEGESMSVEDFDIHSERYMVEIPVEKYNFSTPKPAAGARSVILWYATVEDYTFRSLTCLDDKLIAIAGLAKRAHVDLGGAYLAGLWERQLHIGLAWMIEEKNIATRAAIYRAPSWSWASIDGPVSWQLIDGYVQNESGFLDSAIELLHFTIDPVGRDVFGPISHAEIVVSGLLLSIPADVLLHNTTLTYPAWMSGNHPGVVGWYSEDEKRMIEGNHIVCLKIATRPFGPGPSLPPTNEMLVLESVGTRPINKGENTVSELNIGVYQRIGFGQVLVTDYFDNAETVNMVLV